jgi:hypothetical protein
VKVTDGGITDVGALSAGGIDLEGQSPPSRCPKRRRW